MIILGIDPGTASTGWGIIQKSKIKNQKSKRNGVSCVSYGCIKTPKEMIMPKRLLMLQKELKKVIKNYQPDCLAMEQLFFGVNSKTAMSVGQARGVIMVTAAEKKIPFFEYQGLQVKFMITGYGRSDKKKIQTSVKKYLKMAEKPKPDDAADALAVAICHLIKNEK